MAHQAARKLNKSLSWSEAVFNALPNPAVVIDGDDAASRATIIAVNQAFIRSVEQKKSKGMRKSVQSDSCLGLDYCDLISPRLVKSVEQAIVNARSTGLLQTVTSADETSTEVMEIVSLEGELKESLILIMEKQGVGLHENASAGMLQETLYQKFLEQVPAIVFIKDERSCYRYTNRQELLLREHFPENRG